MSSTYAMVRPDDEAWAHLPRRASVRRQAVIAWVIALATTAGAFAADRGWETFDEDAWQGAYRTVDMFGLASLLLVGLFAVGGWGLRGHAVAAAPLVLIFAAVPHTLEGYASAWVWWTGCSVAVIWAVLQAHGSLQQLRAVAALAHASARRGTAELGPRAAESIRWVLLRRLIIPLLSTTAAVAAWFAAFNVLPEEIGQTYQELGEESLSNLLAAAGGGASIIAIATWMGYGWTVFARSSVGPRLIWEVPSTGGPVSVPPSIPYGPGFIPVQETRSGPCICLAELMRAFPELDEEIIDAEGVYPSDYCPVHGIDRINGLSPEEFRTRAHHPWIWAEDSDVPGPFNAGSDHSLLIGYAGHAFTGVPALPQDGKVDTWAPRGELAQEISQDESFPDLDKPQRPSAGVLDHIDLRPAGFEGHAVRYRHGRAWYETTQPPHFSSQK